MTVDRIKFLLEGLALKNGGRAKMCKEAQEALQLLAIECGEQETLNAVNALLGVEAAKFALAWVLEGSKLPQDVKPTPSDTVVIETPADPILTRVYAKKTDVIGFDANVPASWPRKTSIKNDRPVTVNAIACINGKKFDWVKVGQHEKGVENLRGAKYGQRLIKGETYPFSLTDIHGENETVRLPFVWPWESTGR